MQKISDCRWSYGRDRRWATGWRRYPVAYFSFYRTQARLFTVGIKVDDLEICAELWVGCGLP